MLYDSQNPWTARRGGVATQGEYDLGLRQYMLRVYNYMASGLFVTGCVAWLAFDSGVTEQLKHSPLMWLVMLAPFGSQINDPRLSKIPGHWAWAQTPGLNGIHRRNAVYQLAARNPL